MAIKLVVGLGNPGKKYEGTRHNVGYRVLDILEKQGLSGAKLFRPTDFMNSSGISVAEKARKGGIAPNEILVVCDDFSLPLKRMRIRTEGSSGGHNGLKSILETFNTLSVPRLRIGIGPVPDGEDPADFVLKNFRDLDEVTTILTMVSMAADAVKMAVTEGLEKAMNEFNRELDIA